MSLFSLRTESIEVANQLKQSFGSTIRVFHFVEIDPDLPDQKVTFISDWSIEQIRDFINELPVSRMVAETLSYATKYTGEHPEATKTPTKPLTPQTMRELRMKNGIKLQDITNATGLSVSELLDFEYEKTQFSSKQLQAILDYMTSLNDNNNGTHLDFDQDVSIVAAEQSYIAPETIRAIEFDEVPLEKVENKTNTLPIAPTNYQTGNSVNLSETKTVEISQEPLVAKGTYEEALNSGGKIIISQNSWSIYYYFSGPDLRYNGTSISIPGKDIDAYINAFNENFQEFLNLKNNIPPKGEFTKTGKMNMQIRVGGYWEGVCIRNHHMPISNQKRLNEIIQDFKYSKKQAEKIQKLLFGKP